MPGICLTLSGAPDPAAARKLVPLVSEITCRVLGKSPERAWVILRHIPHDEWFIAGRSLAELGRKAFKLEVTVTDETTTTAQKAAFAAEAFARLADAIGNIHPHSNIHVIDCRATSYSYGGVTQERYNMVRVLEGG